MGESQGPAGEKVGTERERTPEQVREEIERTRAELGDTVAELAAKTDVKARARAGSGQRRRRRPRARPGRSASTAGTKKDELAASAREAMPPSADAARRQVVSRAQDHRLALVGLAAFSAGLIIGKRRS